MLKRFLVCLLLLSFVVVGVFGQGEQIGGMWQIPGGGGNGIVVVEVETDAVVVDYVPFVGLLVFVLLGLFAMFSRIPVFMIVVGVVGFAVAGLVFTTYHGVGVLFSPYSELLLALVCVFDFAVAGKMVKSG